MVISVIQKLYKSCSFIKTTCVGKFNLSNETHIYGANADLRYQCQLHFGAIKKSTIIIYHCIIQVRRKGEDTRILAIITQVKGYASSGIGLGREKPRLTRCVANTQRPVKSR